MFSCLMWEISGIHVDVFQLFYKYRCEYRVYIITTENNVSVHKPGKLSHRTSMGVSLFVSPIF